MGGRETPPTLTELSLAEHGFSSRAKLSNVTMNLALKWMHWIVQVCIKGSSSHIHSLHITGWT